MMKIEKEAKLNSNHASPDEKMEGNLETENNFETSELILDHNNFEHTRSQDNDTISNVNKRTWLDCDCEGNTEKNENKKFKTHHICVETEITISNNKSSETGKNILDEDREANGQILENTIQKLEPTLLYVSKAIPKSVAIFESESKASGSSDEFFITSINDNNIELLEEEISDNENNINNFETAKTKDIFNTPKKEHVKNNNVEANHESHDIFDNNNKEAEKNNEMSIEQEVNETEHETTIDEIIIEKEVDDNRMRQKEEVKEKEKEPNEYIKEQEKNKEEEINKDVEKTSKEETIQEKVDTANKEEIKKEEATAVVEIIHENEKVPLILTNTTETKHVDEEISPKNVDGSAENLVEENQTSTTEDRKDDNYEPSVSPTDYLQKSEMDSKLIQTILKHQMASYFQNMSSFKPYALNLVKKGSCEYQLVQDLFSPTSRGLNITKLERVENPYLLGMYLLKKEKMKSQGSVQEKTLFHGTPIKNIDGICKYNFDWRRCGQSRGHKFGQGVSFSPQVSYADHYTHGDNVMLLAKVLVSQVVVGNSDTVMPTEPYDTTKNHDGNVLVKYEDDDFYPQYVIYYD